MSGLLGEFPGFIQVILAASLCASVLAAMVLILQFVTRRFLPARYRFALWFLVLIRLTALPLPQSSVSVFNLFNRANTPARERGSIPQPALMHASSVAAAPMGHQAGGHSSAMAASPESFKMPPSGVMPTAPAAPAPLAPTVAQDIPSHISPYATVSVPVSSVAHRFPWLILTVLYLAGVALFALRHLLAMVGLRRIVRSAEVLEDSACVALLDRARAALGVRRPVPLLVTDALSSPAVTGLWRPRLLMPRKLAAALSPQDMYFVFVHECAHLRRHDILLNWWLAALSAVHWFNPMVWLLMPRIRADRELACDELVLLHTAEPVPYGHTLLKIFESVAVLRPAGAAVGIVESRSYFTRRIQMIAAFRKTPVWLAAPSVAALVLLACATLTNGVLRGADEPTLSPGAAPGIAVPAQAPDASTPTAASSVPAAVIFSPNGQAPGAGIPGAVTFSGQVPGAGTGPMPVAAAPAADPGTGVPAPAIGVAPRVVKVFTLKYADAVSAAESITKAAVAPFTQVVADKRTNSMVVYGPAGEVAQVEKLIEALDVPTLKPAITPPVKPGTMKVYDVHELLNVPENQTGPLDNDQRNAMLDLVKTVNALVKDTDYTISSFNGTLVVLGSDDAHQQIFELLDQLQQARLRRIDIQQERQRVQQEERNHATQAAGK